MVDLGVVTCGRGHWHNAQDVLVTWSERSVSDRRRGGVAVAGGLAAGLVSGTMIVSLWTFVVYVAWDIVRIPTGAAPLEIQPS